MGQSFRLSELTGIQVRPARLWTHSLSWVLFITGIALYAHFSIVRHRENPEDRVRLRVDAAYMQLAAQGKL